MFVSVIVGGPSPGDSNRGFDLPRPTRARRRTASGLLFAVLLLLAGGVGHAQWRREGRTPPRFHPPVATDRAFTFCRLMYDRVRIEDMGMGWVTDYPYADVNMMVRLSELTKTRVSFEAADRPNHYVVRATDAALFLCPFIMASGDPPCSR